MADDEIHARLLDRLREADEALSSAMEARGKALTELKALREKNPDGFFPEPKREAVLTAASERAKSFSEEATVSVFRELLSASDAMLAPLRVSFVVDETNREAATSAWGASAVLVERANVAEVLADVARGESVGVVLIENGRDGVHTQTLDAVLTHEVKLVGELSLASGEGVARYGLVGKTLPSRTGTDRTMIAIGVPEKAGALYTSLSPFAEREINLTRLESRRNGGGITFFLEFDGHATDRPVISTLTELANVTRFVQVIGSYRRPR